MAKTLDIEIFKVINAGNFWAHPIASPGSEFQDFMGKLNDHFRKSTTSQAVSQLVKGQMCVVRRTSDSCWYRARVQNVLQTLSGPQASVFLVDLAESTLVPCCWIREVPVMLQNIPVQAMECYLTGLKPLGLVTSYFDLTTSKQVTDQWDESATNLFKTLIQGCKLQVSIQRQDEKGKYHVLLLADTGRVQICINDELVIKGFATYFSDPEPVSEISATKAAKIKAMNDKFQKEGVEMLQNLREYVKHGKFTGSEESNSTDDELMDHRNNHRFSRPGESPLDVLRCQASDRSSSQKENHALREPSARIPKSTTQSFPSQRFSSGQSFLEGAFGGGSTEKEKKDLSRMPAVLSSSDENTGRVRFLSSRLPATGSGMSTGFPAMPSKSPDSTNLKPILKKRSPHGIRQGSGSSSETDDLFHRKHTQLDRDDSGVSSGEIPELGNHANGEISSRKEPLACSNAIAVDALFGHHRTTVVENASCARKSESTEPMTQANNLPTEDERSPAKILSKIESLLETSRSYESASDFVTETLRTNATSSANLSSGTAPGHDQLPAQSSANKGINQNGIEKSLHESQLLPTSSTSSVKSPLPSEMLLSSKSSSSPLQPTGGTKLLFSEGAVICTEGAPAPKPITLLEHCPFAHFLPRLGVMQASLIQQHAWPALLRGRDVVGICSASVGQILAYLLPIIYQIVEERELYADLPKVTSGPQLLVLAPTWGTVAFIYNQCKDILARNRNIRTQRIFAAGAEENQILPIINGCEILIATPPCFLRMLRKSYVTLDRLCHTVFHDADIMVEDFTSEIKEIMRHYARLLKSQPNRSAPRQAVVMASSWSVGVASLVKAYLGNPVLIIPDMIEAAIYRGVKQIVTICSESQRDVELLGCLDLYISTRDICVFASKAAEAENIGNLLKANCYFVLVAHEFLDPQQLASVKRQWNTPHTTGALPVLVMTDGVINQMNITNASCVIHFNFPASKTQCGNRLTTLAGTFTSSEEHGCVSVIFVTDERNMLHSPAIRQLVKRSGQEVPPLLEAMADLAIQEKENARDLCHSVKAFGSCRYKRGTRNCSARHSVLAELDKPVKGVPTSGIVKVLILNVVDASCYWVRILEHKPTDENQTSSEIADSTEFLDLTMAVSGWYADPNHRVKQELIVVGDLCCVKLENSNSFHRVKVCKVTKRDDCSKKPLEVLVHFVDNGVTEEIRTDRLLQLPPQFHSCPHQAVQMFVCRVQPLDKEVEWTDETSAFVANLIEGKEMEGKVVLSLGNTMWLDPLVERKYLKNINVTTNAVNIRLELLKGKRATENKQHVRLLRNICEGVIDLQPLEGGASNITGETSSEQLPALETVVLPEDGFHSVYVSAVENPELFFVQLTSSEESLEYLKQKINSDVGKVDLDGSEITIGSLCVAKFTEDDMWYRARVLGSRPENEYDVFYVDFGDREWVTADRIVPAWKSILQVPLQAIECSLVNVDPLENEWSDVSSDAFWEMVNDQLLFAKVKSKSASLVAGCHRFAIELYNTNTEHDVIISLEMVATGHAQTSPEGIKALFPYSSNKQDDYDFPYQRIPDMCLEAHQCGESAKKIEIVKQVQSIVINIESSKDDLRDCGAIQALCRLLSLNRDPLILPHVLASLASLSFESESNCDEVRNQGGLQMMCYLLTKISDSAVQESLAWALKNLSATERNQNEARIRGGIKALCELLKNSSDEKVLERAAWTVGSLVQDNDSNCQAVQECGGLKTLCELVAQTLNENVLERATWALGMLAIDLKNRNFIRQYGGIENICKKLQESPSQQIIKQCALTLKTLASNNQYNRDIMMRLGMIGTLRSFMTDETQRLSIISRRVCGDLLQRLLGSAAGTSPQAPTPVCRTQGCSTSPGSDKSQDSENRVVHGPVDNDANGGGDDFDGLPPLEGEDSDKENANAASVNASPPVSVSAKAAAKDNVKIQKHAVASARPINRSRPAAVGDARVAPFSLHPKTVWSQTRDLVRVCVKLRGVETQQTEITASRLLFRTQMGSSLYELDLELFEDVDSERSMVAVKGAEVQILLKKRNHAVWTRLLRSKEKLPYVSIDFDRWEVWSSSEEDEGDDNTDPPVERANPSNAQRDSVTNPSSSRRESDDRGQRKQVLLPEMLVSDSESGEESVASDIDCLDFR